MVSKRNYSVRSVAHAAEILKAFRRPSELLRLNDILERTRVPKGVAFRILQTLQSSGLLERNGRDYRSLLLPYSTRRFRIGYAAQGAPDEFVKTVNQSIAAAAAQNGNIDLILLDNEYSKREAEKNVARFLSEGVELVIEYQTDAAAAPYISSRLQNAGVPVIAIDIPHPGATYFGADNYNAGLAAGRCLGRWARLNWNKQLDALMLMDLPRAGNIAQARLNGIQDGVREQLSTRAKFDTVTVFNGNGEHQASYRSVRKILARTRLRKTLIGGINDPSVLGALQAFEEAGQAEHCAAAGQGGSPEGRAKLATNGRFIGTVAYFPERYGEAVLRLALDLLAGKTVPPATFTEHKLLTPKNVVRHYPVA